MLSINRSSIQQSYFYQHTCSPNTTACSWNPLSVKYATTSSIVQSAGSPTIPGSLPAVAAAADCSGRFAECDWLGVATSPGDVVLFFVVLNTISYQHLVRVTFLLLVFLLRMWLTECDWICVQGKK